MIDTLNTFIKNIVPMIDTSNDPPSHRSLLIYDPRMKDGRKMETMLSQQGYDVKIATDIKVAKDFLRKDDCGYLISHVTSSDCDGMNLLKWVNETVIGLKKYGLVAIDHRLCPELSRLVFKLGANDCFFFDSLTVDNLTVVLVEILKYAESIEWCDRRSDAFKECTRRMLIESNSHGSLLITGESGVGKSSIAQTIHAEGCRKNMPFVVADCSQYAGEHDAMKMLRGQDNNIKHPLYRNQQGLLSQSNGGTLFIRNIHKLPLVAQEVLADVIQRHVFIPHFMSKEINFTGRIIASTGENLEHLVSEGDFSEKLYHLITSSVLHVTTLAECQEDVIPLANTFIHYYCKRNDINVPKLTKGAMNKLENHIWGGNVRELFSTISRACSEFRGDTIGKDDIVLAEISPVKIHHSRAYEVKKALRRTKGNKAAAARQLGITRATLYIWMDEDGIERDYQ